MEWAEEMYDALGSKRQQDNCARKPEIELLMNQQEVFNISSTFLWHWCKLLMQNVQSVPDIYRDMSKIVFPHLPQGLRKLLMSQKLCGISPCGFLGPLVPSSSRARLHGGNDSSSAPRTRGSLLFSRDAVFSKGCENPHIFFLFSFATDIMCSRKYMVE